MHLGLQMQEIAWDCEHLSCVNADNWKVSFKWILWIRSLPVNKLKSWCHKWGMKGKYMSLKHKIDGLIYLTNWPTNWWTDRLADWRTDIQTNWLSDISNYEKISLHHSFTPSLPVRHLETWGSFHMKKPEGMLFEKFEFNSYSIVQK